MNAAAKEQERAAQVVALAAGHDPKRLRLSAAEGYLLSRIDGRTPWRLLREIGGIPPSDVDACLERWLAEGVVEIVRLYEREAESGLESGDAARAATLAAYALKIQPTRESLIDLRERADEAGGRPNP